jgi:hypothetical protein
VNGLGHPELIWIDPATGDIHPLNGWLYDCPPYGA